MPSLEQVSERAKDVHFGRSVLSLIAAVLFGLGWLAAKAFALLRLTLSLLWLALAWCAVLIKLGWQDARKPSVSPT